MTATLPERAHVVVIGGGLAGLAAGWSLARRGARVVVLEAEERLGGRASSWIDEVTGHAVHIGPHILLSAYANMLAWMEALGTADRVVWVDDAFIHLVDGPACHAVRAWPGLPAPLHFVPNLLRDPALRRRDVASNVRVTLRAMRTDEADILHLDDENALGFLLRMGVTRRCIDRFWRFVAMSILNVPLELCSAGALLRFYREMIGSPDTRFGIPATGLGDLYAPAAARDIAARDGVVRTGAAVARIRTKEGRVDAVILTDGRVVATRQVIAAVPPRALRALLPMEQLRAPPFASLARFEPCPYVSVMIWFDRKLTDRRFWARTFRPTDLNCDFYDLSNLPGWPSARSIVASNVIWAHRAADLPDAEVVRGTVREIAEFLPAAADAAVLHAAVHRIPLAVHCPFPGSERLRPPPITPIPGLLLAGDWVRTGVPACMEGAVQSGFMAAEAVLSALGRPEQLVRPLPSPAGLVRLFHLPTELRYKFNKSLRTAPSSATSDSYFTSL